MSSPRSPKPAAIVAAQPVSTPVVKATASAESASMLLQRKYPPIRLLAAAGIVVGFVAGLALNNIKADTPTRTLAMADQPRAAAAPQYGDSVDRFDAEYLPMLAQD